MTHLKIALSQWKPIHEVDLDEGPDGLRFSDTTTLDWHLMAFSDTNHAGRRIDLIIEASPSSACNTWLYLNHWGGVDIGYISPTADVLSGRCEKLFATMLTNGKIRIEISYIVMSGHGTIYLGTAKEPGQPRYAGSGNLQWTLHSVHVKVESADSASIAERLVVVDVGAAGGVDGRWLAEMKQVHFVLVEPDPEEAAILRAEMIYSSAEVVEVALYNCSGVRDLFVARFNQCSSLLEPDFSVLGRYKVAPCFEVTRKISVDCRRYDEIPNMPAPDMIKIDAQGVEYEVLEGFGRYLDTVLGVDLETHFYPIYKGQKLIGDLVAMLVRHGLRLRHISPQSNFDRDCVEVNAYFTRERTFSEEERKKLEKINQILNLGYNDGGEKLSAGLRD